MMRTNYCFSKIMSKDWCFDCQNEFDARHGHHCVHGWLIPKTFHSKNAHFPLEVQENDCESQLTFSVTEKESGYATSVIKELGNTELDVSVQTNIIDQQTNRDIHFSQSLACASEKMKQKFMVCNSVQTYIQESAKRETVVQAKPLTHPVSRISYNLPLEACIHNSRILVNNCGKENIKSQLSTFGKSSMLNNENNNPEFIKSGMNIHPLMLNEKSSEFFSKGHQQRSYVEMDQQLSKNGQNHSQERKLNIEFESTITVPNNVIVSKSRQIAHDSNQENELKNMSCPFPIKENTLNQQLKSSNMSAVEWRQDCAFTGSLNSHEKELTFGNQFYHGDQKQITSTEFPNQHTTTLMEPCYTDANDTVIRPSRSLDSELSCSICLKEFSSKWNLKRHYQIHSGARSFICNICQQNFTRRSNLYRHEREIHMCAKSHVCEVCGNFFSRKNHLERHILIHTGEKHY